jgi:hypothetical protein
MRGLIQRQRNGKDEVKEKIKTKQNDEQNICRLRTSKNKTNETNILSIVPNDSNDFVNNR